MEHLRWRLRTVAEAGPFGLTFQLYWFPFLFSFLFVYMVDSFLLYSLIRHVLNIQRCIIICLFFC